MRLSWFIPLALIPLVACSPSGPVETGPSGSDGAKAPEPPKAPDPPKAPAAPALHLQALSATSGSGAGALLDGKASTSWKPAGDAADEGILLRFEEPTVVGSLSVAGCSGAAPPLTLFLDGSRAAVKATGEGSPTVTLTPLSQGGAALKVRSIFLKIGASSKACISEITVKGSGGASLNLAPPRSVTGEVVASSVLKPADAYHPGYLFDQRTDFGWVEGVKGTGSGESLTVKLSEKRRITGLQIWNGYQRSADHFKKNARVKTLKVSAPGGAPQTLNVADTMGRQLLSLATPIEGDSVVLAIGETVAGTRYADLVISELRFEDADGPFTVMTADMKNSQTALVNALEGQPLGGVIDTRFAPACDEGDEDYTFTEGSLKLRSNHSFVFYEKVTSEMDGQVSTEVFDGAWVVARSASPWSEIKLYGRRHRISENWSPYTGNDTSESTRVSGGNVKVARVSDLGQAGLKKHLADWKKRGVAQGLFACPRFDPGGASFATAYGELVERKAVLVEGKAMVGAYARPR